LLGLNPLALQAVQMEQTKVLPGFDPIQAVVRTGPSRLSSTVQVAGGQGHFQLSAGATENFTIEASSDLTNWISIGTTSLTLGASTTVNDPQAASFTNRFYRAVQDP
jgi:hypothetical protein